MAWQRRGRKLLGYGLSAAALSAACWAQTPQEAAPPVVSGFDIYREACESCHELYDPESPKHTRAEWNVILDRMLDRGAVLNGHEYVAVLNYLDSFNRPKREIRWNDAPAKSRTALFAVADRGKLPSEWVDMTLGGSTPAPWAVQANGADKSAYLQPLKTVPEGQFPAAIDNTGIVKNGSFFTRAQLLSGRGSVGVGMIFGFRDAQNYFSVRVGTREVALYEVRDGQQAVRARTTATISRREWQTVEVSVEGQQAHVSLNGKPLPELSVTLEGHSGGRGGLHTQGDTIAVFDQWRLTNQE